MVQPRVWHQLGEEDGSESHHQQSDERSRDRDVHYH